MSEIAKCPVCGEEPGVLIDLFDKHGRYPKGYACCGAEFVELECWNQYAKLRARVTRLEEALKDIEQRAESMNWESIAKIASRALEEK